MKTGMENTLADMQGTVFTTIDEYVGWLKYAKKFFIEFAAEKEATVDLLSEIVKDEMQLLEVAVLDMEKLLDKKDWIELMKMVEKFKTIIALRLEGIVDFDSEEE